MTNPTPLTPDEEIVCPNCNERQSKRLLCRQCATNMPMGIAAKLEDERAAREARRTPRDSSRSRERHRSHHEDAPAAIWGFGFSGRIGRLTYLSAHLQQGALFFFLYVLALSFSAKGLMFMIGLISLLCWLRIGVLRLHDFNRSGWWVLLYVVPVVNVVLWLLQFFMPGNDEENDYGGAPHSGSGWMVLVSIALLILAIIMSWSRIEKIVKENPELLIEAAMTPENISRDAAVALITKYKKAPTHKAFAMSQSGAWGWKGGATSVEEATQAAISACEVNRQPPDSSPCAVVRVNDK